MRKPDLCLRLVVMGEEDLPDFCSAIVTKDARMVFQLTGTEEERKRKNLENGMS